MHWKEGAYLFKTCTNSNGILYAMLLLRLDHFISSRPALSVLYNLEMYGEIILDNWKFSREVLISMNTLLQLTIA